MLFKSSGALNYSDLHSHGRARGLANLNPKHGHHTCAFPRHMVSIHPPVLRDPERERGHAHSKRCVRREVEARTPNCSHLDVIYMFSLPFIVERIL